MDFGHWISLLTICLLGAMSPGPSLAVVVNSALSGGRGAGLVCAVSHGVAVGLYGLLTVTGLAVIIARSPALFLTIQLAGAAYLLYLGLRTLNSESGGINKDAPETGRRGTPVLDGFMVAFLNPKLAVFMLALFSQFLRPEADIFEKGAMALTVGATDALWYGTMAMLVTHPVFFDKLQARSALIDRIFGLLLIVLAVTVVVRALL